MNEEMEFKVAPTRSAPIAAITRVDSKFLTDGSKCEANVNVGLFFDGTKNNREFDKKKLKHTNVVRLYEAYWNEPGKGYFPRYIPGVGTPFREIRETGTSDLGSGFGNGCEQRVLFGLLHVFDALHMGAHDGAHLLTAAQVTALCCNSFVQSSADDQDCVALGRLGLSRGLLMLPGGQGRRVPILKDLAKRLESALAKGRPRIKECFIDVFGFSRGAAQARVFCSWLDEILTDGKLAGVIVHVRFVGLMDTVASAGFVSSVNAAVTDDDGGHSGWAESRYLRIPESVQNCVHMIAGHELRKNFPIDTLINGGKLPPRCQEFVYPGAHSDVGGGYEPGDLGIAYDSDKQIADAQKLSQIPLNHLLACAIAAGVPVNKNRAKDPERNYDPFAISPLVQKAYDDFVTCSTLTPRPLHEWLQPYLNWRWQVRLSYDRVHHVGKANKKDRELLIAFNDKLMSDAALIFNPPKKAPGFFKTLAMFPVVLDDHMVAAQYRAFEVEARSVINLARAAPPTDERLSLLFNVFVHDSLAGFDSNLLELSGYWHYRRGFLGTEKRLVVESDAPPDTDKAAA